VLSVVEDNIVIYSQSAFSVQNVFLGFIWISE